MKPDEIDQTIAKFAYAVRANDKYFDSSGGTVKISDKYLKKTMNLSKKGKYRGKMTETEKGIEENHYRLKNYTRKKKTKFDAN